MRMRAYAGWWCGLLLLMMGLPGAAQETTTGTPGEPYLRSDRLGITHIGSAEIPADDARYRQALALGAGWTRYPFYWYRLETAPGVWDWSAYDRVVIDDVEHGLQTNAVLLGIPAFHASADDIIRGLNEPVFADGSDVPRAGKSLNPANPWALYVYQVVQRYKPGGELAALRAWVSGQGVRVWEIWNEPDLPLFWSGSIRQYARLLKVAYLAAHHADAEALVMLGGLLYNTEENWLARILALYSADALAAQANYFMDAVAVHAYGYPWRSGWLVLVVRETLEAYGLERPIWLNETGVSAWDDYPGPVWTRSPAERPRTATIEQQAWYLLQSAAYAWAEGADKVFYHQLYDDCGDQPAGTTFPPHRGELCVGGALCYGSAFGLYRNETTSVCYNQHPAPGTARPAARAYQLLAQVLGQRPAGRGRVTAETAYIAIQFGRPSDAERVTVVWNRRFEPYTWSMPATGTAARLFTLEGVLALTPEADGTYRVLLPPAQPDNYPSLERGDVAAIGGPPALLVERFSAEPFPPLAELVQGVVASPPTALPALPLDPAAATPTPPGAAVAPAQSLEPTPGAVLLIPPTPTLPPLPPLQPTVPPEQDTRPPVPFMEPLPVVSPVTFLVRWGAQDDGQVVRYLVWVKVDAGDWLPWLETARTEGYYTGVPGSLYSFAVWAVDAAGNWSDNVSPVAQATTRVE